MKIIVAHSGMSLALIALELANNPESGLTSEALVIGETDEVVDKIPPVIAHDVRDTVIFGGSRLEVASLIVALGSMDIGRSHSLLKLTSGEDFTEIIELAPIVKEVNRGSRADWKSNQSRINAQSKRLAKFGR